MIKFVALLLAVAIFGMACAADSFSSQAQFFMDIADSVERAKRPGEDFFARNSVCYQDLGCFTKDGPMKHTGLFPYTVEKIATAFYAYTAASPGAESLVDPYKPETFGVINALKRLAIIIHGFGNTYKTAQLQSIKNHLLEQSDHEVGTVIVVDWPKGSAQPLYNEASTNSQVVGRQVAHLVNELIKHHGVNSLNVYLIGFSLGAQVAGFAGKWSQSEYNWMFGRITGLDAAAPLFESYPGSFLTKNDAVFVDGIHSSAGNNILLGEIGFVAPYGHVDFYPNSGRKQPHCTNLFEVNCNHYGSVLFYDASLSAQTTCRFNAYSCAGSCRSSSSTRSDVELGYRADRSTASGNRYLSTSKKYPFCNV